MMARGSYSGMKLSVAVLFDSTQARAAAVAFDAWDDEEATKTFFSTTPATSRERRSSTGMKI